MVQVTQMRSAERYSLKEEGNISAIIRWGREFQRLALSAILKEFSDDVVCNMVSLQCMCQLATWRRQAAVQQSLNSYVVG